jgi:hypothetical protein
LKSLCLVSICEGHMARGSDRRPTGPHINLRLRSDLTSAAYADWDGLSPALAAEFRRLFPPDRSAVEAEFRLSVRNGRTSSVCRQVLVIRIRSLRVRESHKTEPEVADWFRDAVTGSEALDELVVSRLTRTARG